MNDVQKARQDELMSMPMKDWPEPLKQLVTKEVKRLGFSGGVISDLIEWYILNVENK